MALIPGDELPDEYVIIGAHYDHLGTGCDTADPADTICNGATDNATGVAAVLSIGEQLARQGHGPSRSVILAFWDREEDGLLGARAWIADPLVPVAQTVAYVNYDIQGANILPTLRDTTFAIGAETGGERLTAAVGRAVRPGQLDTHQLSWIFGQGRSDYLPFIQAGVPTVFFSDSTGPCYHTAQDEADIVDYRKLRQQVRDGVRLARDLAGAARRRPSYPTRPRRPTTMPSPCGRWRTGRCRTSIASTPTSRRPSWRSTAPSRTSWRPGPTSSAPTTSAPCCSGRPVPSTSSPPVTATGSRTPGGRDPAPAHLPRWSGDRLV